MVARNGGVRLFWRREGSGEPVLMIMGLGANHRGWARLLPHVAAGHEAIVFDNRGTGSSSRVTGPLTMDDLVADALAVLDAAGHESAHVIGASMGGMIAQHLALEHRDRVRSLLLCCTSPVGRGGQPPWQLLATNAVRPFVAPERTMWLLVPTLYARRTREHHRDRIAEDLRHRLAEPTPPLTTWAQLAAIAAHDTRHQLAELAGLPVTVVHGAEDVLVPPGRGAAIAAAIPGARLETVRPAAHLAAVEQAAAVNALILDHLELR